ncbi:MAG: radical SAM protein [Lachnospiraceae bacterium]|nr:radical SAM protein [Lachnospiraceae bacterium]
MKIVFLYPPSPYLNHSMFKHYTYFAETIEIISRKYKDVCALDCAVEMKSRNEIYEKFRDADFLITMIEPYNIRIATELMEVCKSISKSSKTIVYGTAATLIPNYLSTYDSIDYVIANGEFAEGIFQILHHVADDPDKILFPRSSVKERRWGCSLDSCAPLERYKRWGKGMFEFTVQVGCPFNCTFCSEKVLFRQSEDFIYAQRPVNESIAILKRIKDEYDSVYFSATTFTYDREWVLELCRRMTEENCVIPWRSDTRVDCLDVELVQGMREAGLKQLSLGIESLEDDVLRRVNKRQTSSEIMETIQMCKENGVGVKALLILGIPGQTAEDVFHTQKMVEELGIPYRWKEYSPIRELHYKDLQECDVSRELDKFSRNTFLASSIKGLSTEQYMDLLFPKGYIR